MQYLDRLVYRTEPEIFLLATQYPQGAPASRWPWGRQSAARATHASVGLFRPQAELEKPRRTARQLTGMWGLVLDDVGTEKTPRRPEAVPTFRIATRPGSEQWGYVFDRPLRDPVLIRQLLDSVIAAKMTDPGGNNPTRLFRLPGSRPPGKPCAARLLASDGPVYMPYTMHHHLGFKLVPKREIRPPETFDKESGLRDPAYAWLRDNGQMRGPISAEGWIPVDCPFGHEHGNEDDLAGYRPASATSRAVFHCFHAHSGAQGGERRVTINDFRRMLVERGAPLSILQK